MKLISLRFKAFAAYLEEQYIDFTSLHDAGLFLISGKTGAGKTAVLDAITYALYGKSSGGNRGDIYAMRCQLAKAEDDTEVELIFEVRGRRYKFIRTLKQKRVNIQGTHNALYMADDGLYVPFFENPHLKDIEQKATELIGLNYEQFRQVIILPQGQFEKLLVAKSDEKEKILVSLFDAEKWQKAAEKFSELVNERKRALENTKLQLSNILSNYGCSSVDELKALCEKKKESSLQIKQEEEVLSEKYSTLKSEAEKLIVIDEKFNSLANLQKRMVEINAFSETVSSYSLKIENFAKGEKIKPFYIKMQETEKECTKRCNELKEKEDFHKKSGTELKQVENYYKELKEKEPAISALKKEITELESLRSVFEKLSGLLENLKEKESYYHKQKKDLDEFERKVQKLTADKEKSEKEVVEKYTEYNNLLTEYLNGMSGSLAKELKTNMPCPVCGSIHHPNPAKFSDTVIDQSALERKNGELETAKTNRDILKDKLTFAEQELRNKQDSVSKILLEIEKDHAIIDNIKTGIKGNISSLSELEKEIQIRLSEVQMYEDELVKTENKHSALKVRYASENAAIEFVKNEYESICAEYETAKVNFDESLIKNGFSSPEEYNNSLIEEYELEKMKKYVSDYESEKKHINLRLTELKKDTDGKEKPEIETVRQKLKSLEDELLNKRGEYSVVSSEINEIEKQIKTLNSKFRTYLAEEEQNIKDQVFAKRMRGDMGIGIQRYLLGVVLSQITAEANRLLENVHGGRYRLLRTLEGSGLSRKTGLELEVYDSFSGERRGVTTLSGGEKFLVALSLSIGLSTVVQSESSGINIETMFIDEGFGSLDPASITDALNVLGQIKNSGSLIGIISHVDELKDNIPAQIEVKKERSGSTLKIYV